jgi:hypothetical protein
VALTLTSPHHPAPAGGRAGICAGYRGGCAVWLRIRSGQGYRLPVLGLGVVRVRTPPSTQGEGEEEEEEEEEEEDALRVWGKSEGYGV